MAKIKNLPRLIAEDFEEENQELISKIAFVTNPAFEQIVQAFNKNITIEDNLNMYIKDVELSVGSNGVPKPAVSFKSGLKGSCRGLFVIKADCLEKTVTYPTSAPFITFSEKDGQINIDHISGIPAGAKYRIRVFSIG